MNNHTEINPPSSNKLTVRWLRDYMPLSWWGWISSIVAIIFSFGLAIGSWKHMPELWKSQISPDQHLEMKESLTSDQYSEMPKPTPTGTVGEDLSLNDPMKIRASILMSTENIVKIIRCQSDLDRQIYLFDLEPYKEQFSPERTTNTKGQSAQKIKEILDARERSTRSRLLDFIRKVDVTIALSNEINKITKQIFLIWNHESKVKC